MRCRALKLSKMEVNENLKVGKNISFRVCEYHEQGYPEIIEIKYKGKWLRYVHFNNNIELEINKYIKQIVN